MTQASEPDEVLALCDTAAVGEGEVMRIEPTGLPPLAVYRVEGEFFVTDDTCTHGEASLADGFVEDGVVECPWHNGKFCVRTGAALNFPATVPLRTWPVIVVGEKICIRVTAGESTLVQGHPCQAN